MADEKKVLLNIAIRTRPSTHRTTWPHYNSNSTTTYVSVPQKHKDWCPYNHTISLSIVLLRYIYMHRHTAREVS